MSVQLLDKTRKINKLLHNNNSSKVVFNDICEVLKEILKSNKESLERNFDGDTKIIIDRIITKAFINFSDDIKKESDLIDAYEGILNILIELNYEKAGVMLDEFRIH